MSTLMQALVIAVLAVIGLRLPKGTTRSRLFTVLKAWFTVLCFWALLTHPMENEAGETVMALELIGDTIGKIDAGTFWLFVALATGIKMIGMLSSMYRWQLMLFGQGIELPFKHLFGSFLIGRAIGTFLPSTAGLDGYTLFDAARFSGRTVEVTAAKFVEKVCGFSGVFMTFLVTLPFGIAIFGENARFFALASVPIAAGVIGGLVVTLLFPGFVQWILENVPIPAKQRITGLVSRISSSAAAYRSRPGLVLQILFLSFLVHFTTAAMYYFTALAIGAVGADFWEVTFGSSIQIFVTVISPFTIAGEGIREAAQYVLLKEQIGGRRGDRLGGARLLGGGSADDAGLPVLVGPRRRLHAGVLARERRAGRLRGGGAGGGVPRRGRRRPGRRGRGDAARRATLALRFARARSPA